MAISEQRTGSKLRIWKRFWFRDSTLEMFEVVIAFTRGMTFHLLIKFAVAPLFAKWLGQGDSEVTFAVFRVKLPPVTTSLTTQR